MKALAESRLSATHPASHSHTELCHDADAFCAGSPAVGRLALWNLRAFKRVATFSLAGDPALRCLAWAQEGRQLLAAGADGTARLFDVASRAEARDSFMCMFCFKLLLNKRYHSDAQPSLNLPCPTQCFGCCY